VPLYLKAVGKVLAWLVDHHMPARHEKQPPIAFEEEAARSGERTPVVKGRDPDGGQQQRLNHASLCSYRKQFAFRPCAVQGELPSGRGKVGIVKFPVG